MPGTFHGELGRLSLLKYAWWRAVGQRRPVTLALRTGGRFQLRPSRLGGLGNNDYGVAYDVFVDRHYDQVVADPATVRQVVDLGGNVGLSCIFWLAKYPRCRVEVFEPHPGHVAQMKTNLDLNGWRDRVTIHEAAAGAAPARLQLCDRGSGSSLMYARPGEATIEVEVVDVFRIIGGLDIDVLKIDIEGGEYALLDDRRFAALKVRHLILEWHQRKTTAADRAWTLAKLATLGYRARELFTEPGYGMVSAARLQDA
jgi:FkbM family methyltransferase